VLSAEEVRRRLGPGAPPVRLEVVETPLIDISSRDLRRRARAGRSLRYFVPRAVECYVRDKRLYAPG
jgi:nicotinate-nucleotide adenylyltransferase